MFGGGSSSRSASFRPENLGQNALAMIGNLCFALFVFAVLIFTIIAATYQPEDPLFHSSSSNKITNFLVSTSNATFMSDVTLTRTGEDFLLPSNQTSSDLIIKVTDVDSDDVSSSSSKECGDSSSFVDCSNTDIFHLMMTTAIEQFKDIHFYRFGKPVPGSNSSTCDMAWRFRPKDAKAASFYKDYRRFFISKSPLNCTFNVLSIGGYHTGGNARKRKRKPNNGNPGPDGDGDGDGFQKNASANTNLLPVIGELVNDSLPVVESEASFSRANYLIYSGGGDRCKSMDHFLWSFLCALGEAKYLNRTLVMDLTICLSSVYTSTNQGEEGTILNISKNQLPC